MWSANARLLSGSRPKRRSVLPPTAWRQRVFSEYGWVCRRGSLGSFDDDLRHRVAPVALGGDQIADTVNTRMDMHETFAPNAW